MTTRHGLPVRPAARPPARVPARPPARVPARPAARVPARPAAPLRLLAVLALTTGLSACGAADLPPTSPGPSPTAGGGSRVVLTVEVVYEPVCGPSSPAPSGCEPRPLAGVGLTLFAADGGEVGRGTSDATGRFVIRVAPGRYLVRGDRVPSAADPRPAEATVTGDPVTVVLRYPSNLQ